MEKIKVTRGVTLSRPEYQLVNAINAFFCTNPYISGPVVAGFDEASATITLTVDNVKQFAALKKRIRPEVKCGAGLVKLVVKGATEEIEATEVEFSSLDEELWALFKSVFSYIGLYEIETEDPVPHTKFATFSHCNLLQYYADDLTNPNGYRSVVPAEFAKTIIDLGGEASITTHAFVIR